MKQTDDESLALSLVRDDLPFRLQRRVGLIPEQGLGTMRRAVFFALLAWLPIVVWAMFTSRILPGTVDEPLLRHFGVHVRFLLAVPLFILGEGMLHQQSTTLTPYFLTSGLVQSAQRQDFVNIIKGITRLRDRTLPWVLITALIVAWTILASVTAGSDLGHEVNWASIDGTGRLGFGGWWFMYVSRPIFIALLAAWLWRLILMFILLKRIARLDLAIVPTHPDGAGGLGFLNRLPKAFSLFAFAVSAVLASRLAHNVLYHGVDVQSLKLMLTVFLIVLVGICLAPLLTFVIPLAAAKRRALLEYGALVGEHGRLVRRRWILGQTEVDDPLLQAEELGPVADTLALYEAVRKMRLVPIDKSSLIAIVVPALIPIAALFSIQIPIKDILIKIATALF
ncbi:hypothetical protein [Methylobacter sp. BBA5.1]|uniref:hypothetical protein n=1 Tax=Methylobacter sp. BBA5.1 TaxID=1495064 RepID=UPI00069086C6|nr:hypothetical protein [Methylobacter sp. BBA5.1]